MSRREWYYLLGSLVVSIACAVVAHFLAVHYNARGGYIEVAVSVLVFLAGFLLAPVRDAAHTLLQDFPVTRCNILLFGPPANGKTQAFRILQGQSFRPNEAPTEEFDPESFYQRAGASNTKFKITVADYAGRSPTRSSATSRLQAFSGVVTPVKLTL